MPDEPAVPSVGLSSDGDARSSRGPMLVGAAVGALIVLVGVLVVVLVTRDGGEEVESTATTSSTESSTTTVPTAPTTLANGDLRGLALRIDVMLDRSVQARADVVEVISAVETGCGIEPWKASTALSRVQASRQEVISELSSLQVTGNQQADELVAMLLAAMQSSQLAGQHFQIWVDSEYARYYYEHVTYDPVTQTSTLSCPGDAPKTQDWDDAVAASNEATDAKEAFVAAWTPVAEQFDLRRVSAAEL